MERLPKDFAGTDKEVTNWHDKWSVEMFGAECGPDRYMNTTPDGRYLYGVKEGTVIERGWRDKVLDKLCRLIKINKKLNGVGLNTPLTSQEIEQLWLERESVYNEYCILIEPEGFKRLLEGKNKPTEPLFNSNGAITQESENKATEGDFDKNNKGIKLPPELDTPKARKAFEKAVEKGYIAKTSTGYKWTTLLPKAAAADLCEKIYCTEITDKQPKWGLLGQFLGLSRLDQTSYQNKSTKGKRKWELHIDELFQE